MSKRVWMTALVAAVATGGVVAWGMGARRNPAACPYAMRFSLDFPRPFLQRKTLLALLAPRPGERVLEIGPGTGYYTLDVARAIAPGGRIDILDLQQEMLDAVMRRALASGISAIAPTRGDAQALPYPDGSFAAAFLVATLGEVPDRDAALRELRRVLKPGGRLVVGEGQPDPHMVSFPELRARAVAAGLRFNRRMGGRLGYLARFDAA